MYPLQELKMDCYILLNLKQSVVYEITKESYAMTQHYNYTENVFCNL